MLIQSLTASIALTPEKLAIARMVEAGQKVIASPASVLQSDNAPNLFALQSLINQQQSQETLLDPKNDAARNTAADINAIQQITQAYAAAGGLVQTAGKGLTV